VRQQPLQQFLGVVDVGSALALDERDAAREGRGVTAADRSGQGWHGVHKGHATRFARAVQRASGGTEPKRCSISVSIARCMPFRSP
jgi:hypothetical protein